MSEVIDDSRRNFLRLALALPVGVIAGSALYPVAEGIGGELEDEGLHTGNTSTRQDIEAQCGDMPNRNECAADMMESPDKRRKAVLGGPIIEELSYRAIPSLMTDMVAPSEGDSYTTPPETVLWGNGDLRLSRKELIMGAVTSVIFGYSHNIDTHQQKLDMGTVPVQAIIGGSVLWYLQRKFGFVSNLSAHVAYNNWWTLGFRRGQSH